MKKIKIKEKKECDSELQPTAAIDCLPDECLILIFKKLTLKNRIGIERVCTRWRKLSLKSWSDVTCLHNIGQKFSDIEHLSLVQLREILWRCGNYVSCLSFDEFICKLKPNQIFAAINKYCTKLENLTFLFCYKHEEINMKKIAPHVAQNLKKWSFSVCYDGTSYINNDSLASFLRVAVNLQTVNLFGGCPSGAGCALLNLPNKCQELELYSWNLNNAEFIQLFQKLPNLRVLDVSRTKILPSALIAISEQLIELKLNCVDEFFKDNDYKNLWMPNLKNLEVCNNDHITDEKLISLSKCFPSLECLNLAGCKNIMFCLSCLSKCNCNKLWAINLSKTKISIEGLVYLVTNLLDLQCLYVENCDNLTKPEIITAIASSPILDAISLGQSSKLDEDFFKDVLKVIRSRTRKPLEIKISCEGQNIEDEIKRLKLKKEKNQTPDLNNCAIILEGIRVKFYVDSDE